MIKRNFNFSETQITASAVDDSSSYLWLAFAKNDEGNCILKKVSAFQPDQVFYSIEIAVDEITAMNISGSYIYLAYDDSTLIGARYSLISPLTSSTNFNIPSGILEAPVDVTVDNTALYYLIPGNTSGNNAKVVELTTTGTFVETIDLSTITQAKSFALDSNTGDLWAVTYTSPANLIRIYETLGVWSYTVTILG